MRFTRAAKVAAFPLLAMVLVVALIACTGPAGPAGKDATAVTGTTGTTGPRGDDALEAHAIEVVVFNSQEADDDETTTGQKETINLNTHLSGGIAEGREFEIVYTAGWVGMANYELTGSMLDVMVPEPFDTTQSPTQYAQDALILVEAKDTDGESAVLYVKVRGNIAPEGGGGTDINLTVGTQAAPSGDGDAPITTRQMTSLHARRSTSAWSI